MARRPVGRMVIWCDTCKAYFNADDRDFDWICPTCRGYVSRMKCNRCGHEWVIRKGKIPSTCPGCDSPYWNRQRMLRRRDE